MRNLLPYITLTVSLFTSATSQSISCNNPADIMFLLDGSDSIDTMEWTQERNFVARMINALNISPNTINIGFTVYSSDVDQHVGLVPYRPKIVLNAMAKRMSHPTGIATNTAKGISKVRQTFAIQPSSRSMAPKIMIVITDGSSENPAETIRQARMAKEDGIRIIAVGVGNNVFVEELQEIATNQRKFYRAADFAALQGIESDIRNMICRVITTTPAPSFTFGPPTTPRGRITLGPNIQCNNPADIVFVIDGSDSISDLGYARLKNFVATLIDNFEIGPDAIHVGLIVYSTLVGNKIGLFPPKNKFVLRALTKNLEHPKFGTDTALGIEAARDMIRDQGRTNAPEMIVVITDGRSTYPANTIVQSGIAKAQGITMIAIGVGSDIFSGELKQIASGPKYVSEVADFRALENTVNVMRDLICTSITTTSTTTTTMLPPTPPPFIPDPPEGLICNVPGDVIFVLDGSDSIQPNDWIRQRNFVSTLINNLEVGRPYIHVSTVVFSTTIGEVIPLMPFKPKNLLTFQVSTLKQPRFGTDTALGIQKARDIFKRQGRPTAPRVAIVVTDGKSTHPDNTKIQSAMAKTDGITMIAVGVGSDIYEPELESIASSRSQVFKVIDFASLTNIIGELRNRICQVVQTTTMAPPTTTTPMPTTTQMTTPMSVPLYPCEESRTEADVLFLMDGTKSMSQYNWMMSKHFTANFLDALEVRPEFVHIGAVISDTFRGDSVGISPFKTRQHLKELIHGMLHPRGDMNTAQGLRDIQNVFNNQGRNRAQKVVIFVTDGSTRSLRETNREAQKLKEKGVDIVSVGIGPGVNMAQLRGMASKPGLTMTTGSFEQAFALLPRLQNVVCELLRKPETTTMQITTPSLVVPPLCDGCLVDQGVGFNSFKGDCTKYVQCWKEGNEIKFLVRACPFGQYWDTDAITCRPSFLVRCTADPCKQSQSGFTYGMSQYGCRAYWKCIDGFSIGHCCPRGSAYIDGMGCIESAQCTQDCPPSGGIAVNPTCDKKPHWDKRYYIEIVYGRGEIVRPCPAGTIFYEEKCECDFGMSGLQPDRPDIKCQPEASFPFNLDLLDKSVHGINVGATNVKVTDLGTAYFNGQGSNMNMWRFANADWGNKLVIKFKFRFDFSNKFIDYGGLPVDLGIDLDANMNLISQYHMTDMDWRLWNELRKVRTLADWRALLKEFGQSRTFYIFLGALGFKPGTSNSLQVVRILGTPEAYAQFNTLLTRMRPRMGNATNKTSAVGLRKILTLLKSMRGLINWKQMIRNLKGDTGDTTGTGGTNYTVIVDVGGPGSTGPGSTGPGGQMGGRGGFKFDHVTGKWVRTGSGGSGGGITVVNGGTGSASGNLLNIAGTDTASEWRFNEKTGQWERLAAIDIGGGGRGGMRMHTESHNSMAGGMVGNQMGGAGVNSWNYKAHGSNRPISQQPGAGGSKSATTNKGIGGVMGGTNSTGGMNGISWNDIVKNMMNMQNNTSGTWQWNTQGANGGATMDANKAALQGLLGQIIPAKGTNGSASWQFTGGSNGGQQMNQSQVDAFLRQLGAQMTGGQGGAGANNTSGGMGNMAQLDGLLRQMETQMGGSFFGATGNTTTGGQSMKDSIARTMLQQIQETARKMGQSSQNFGFDASGSFSTDTMGGAFTGGSASQSAMGAGGAMGGRQGNAGMQGGSFGGMGGATSSMGGMGFGGSASGGSMGGMSMGGGMAGMGGGMTGMGGGMTGMGGGFDMMGGGGSMGGMATDASFGGGHVGAMGVMPFSNVGFGSLDVTSFDTTGLTGMGAGGIGGAAAASGGAGSKRTVQTRVENQQPMPTNSVSGGRVVGASFGGMAGGGAQSTGFGGIQETSSRTQGGSLTGSVTVPQQREFVSGATVIGRGNKSVKINPQTGLRINEFTQDINPATLEAMNRGFASGSAGGVVTGTSGMAGGDFTQMGKVVGSGGGVQRIIDTNVKRMPASAVQFNREGGVSLASLGLGGAEGENIIRHSVKLVPAGNGQFVDGGLVGSASSAPSGMITGTIGGTMDASMGGAMGGSMGGAMGGQDYLSANTINRGGWNRGPVNNQGAGNMLPFMAMEGMEGLFDGLAGKKRRKRSLRNKRQANKQAATKQAYQALVTNCQGQGGKPSIMVVANKGDVQFAVKTYNNEPAVVAVKAVEGWNDVTMIYDGKQLTGVVENWKGFHRASVPLKGNIERRQAGLLVGDCEGFRSFHGELDDLTIYKCLTPAITELRDRVLM